ncbi:MAG TPA: insulinase family protein, partial [Longimicrobiaceae bacterium]
TSRVHAPDAAQDAPAVTVHRQPALPTVALRLSILADDPPGYAGAGHLFQHLLLPSLEDQVARVGGRVQAVRGSDAIVYTVVGPASELDYLAGILRSTLRAPDPRQDVMLASLSALAGERASERETATKYVRAALRAQLFPGDLPAAGTDDAAARLSTARLDEVWGEIYRPDRVSIVAVGDVDLDAVRRAFRSLPPAPGRGPSVLPEDTVPSLEADTPQATRAWIGSAWAANDADPAALSVTARLLRNYLRRRMTRSSVDVEHWWTHHGQALALVVATPDSLAPAARRTVGGALTTLAGNLDGDAVRDAASSVRRDLLFYSRSPERMAELLGEFADRGTGADAAQRFYAALDAVTEDDVRRVLDALGAAEPAAVYVPPQRIPEAQRR